MMGQVGTPVIAVESGKVAILGWNQYGGWRIGIDSFDGKRYYYYAHFIFDESQREGNNEIWVSGYELVKFLNANRSEVKRNDETKEWSRVYRMKE